MEPKDDNIASSSSYDSVDTYVIDSDQRIEHAYNRNYFSISNNLKFEYGMIQKLMITLDSVNAIAVNDLETILSYTKEIESLMLVLNDIHHTLKMLSEFNKAFRMKDINHGTFVIKVSKRNRNRFKRNRKKYKKKLRI